MRRNKHKEESANEIQFGAPSDGTHLWLQHSGIEGKRIIPNLKIAWSASQVPGLPELHSQTLSQNNSNSKITTTITATGFRTLLLERQTQHVASVTALTSALVRHCPAFLPAPISHQPVVFSESQHLELQNSHGEIFAVGVEIAKQAVTTEILLEDLRMMIKERWLQGVLLTGMAFLTPSKDSENKGKQTDLHLSLGKGVTKDSFPTCSGCKHRVVLLVARGWMPKREGYWRTLDCVRGCREFVSPRVEEGKVSGVSGVTGPVWSLLYPKSASLWVVLVSLSAGSPILLGKKLGH